MNNGQTKSWREANYFWYFMNIICNVKNCSIVAHEKTDFKPTINRDNLLNDCFVKKNIFVQNVK